MQVWRVRWSDFWSDEAMKSRNGIARADVVVLLSCLVFVLLALGAMGAGGRGRAREIVCIENLRRWGAVFDGFVQDNDGYFLSGEGGGSGSWWIEPLRKYYKDSRLLLCPEATTQSTTWQMVQYVGGYHPIVGSYGLNGWTCNPRGGWEVLGRWGPDSYWKTRMFQAGGSIPVFVDMLWHDAWPRYTDQPPVFSGFDWGMVNVNEMQQVCINRHNGAVGCLFMDWSARKVGLKELWTLKWHRTFNTEGPWTKAGGVTPADWPQWMREFKDF
jgi:hypothetical protein